LFGFLHPIFSCGESRGIEGCHDGGHVEDASHFYSAAADRATGRSDGVRP
jgi:hypothetical protein